MLSLENLNIGTIDQKFNIEQLRTFHVVNCNITRFSQPDQFFQAAGGALKKLKLSNNKLNEIPSAIAQFSVNLQVLDFSNNKILVLPANLKNLSHLTELDLSHNQLSVVNELPEKLKVLNLSANRLDSLPECIFTMVQLDTATCSYNVLSKWPAENTDFSACQIKTLDVSFNAKLQQPPASLLRDSSISKLQLTGCEVDKKVMLNGMDKNGVFEYQERHKKRLNQAVDNRLDVEYKIFGLE